jgi:hypothetical protein
MYIKCLEIEEINQIALQDINVKYLTQKDTSNIKFTPDEFKSLLALKFAYNYHVPFVDNNKELINKTYLENSLFLNFTTKFGRQLIANLEDDESKKIYYNLRNREYNYNSFFNDSQIIDFVEEILINQMAFRNLEYGKYFLNHFSNNIIENNYNNHSNFKLNIDFLIKNETPVNNIVSQLEKSTKNISIPEALLLTFALKEYLLDTKANAVEYGLVNLIARQKILILTKNIQQYKNIVKETLTTKWDLNKGKGKGKGGQKR